MEKFDLKRRQKLSLRYSRSLILTVIAVVLLSAHRAPAQSSPACEQTPPPAPASSQQQIDQLRKNIKNIVVIYAENRSFDNLYGMFPGADGIERAFKNRACFQQKDRDDSILTNLPPVWKENFDPLTPDPDYPGKRANQPFPIAATWPNLPLSVNTRDLWHRFFQNKEQIDGGRNDKFAAVSDAGGLTMGYYDGSSLAMWRIAKEYVLLDHYFMGAFGGSFLNHFWLVCACTPKYTRQPIPGEVLIALDGDRLATNNSPKTAMEGPPIYLANQSVTPKGDAVNTLQPPYQPSEVLPAPGGDVNYADPQAAKVLPAQTERTIGDALNDRQIKWAWYAGGWNDALADTRRNPLEQRNVVGTGNFQTHHMPFNYFKKFDPSNPDGAKQRAEHLKDYQDLLKDICNGTLPPVAFYKPQGPLNEHPGYSNVRAGDEYIAGIVRQLEHSKQWGHMVVIVTYDENGGFWDHVPPPAGDYWGPGTRVPAIIISPFSKGGRIDSTTYDTTSILKLITERFDLKPLPGIRKGMGDLTNALTFTLPKQGK